MIVSKGHKKLRPKFHNAGIQEGSNINSESEFHRRVSAKPSAFLGEKQHRRYKFQQLIAAPVNICVEKEHDFRAKTWLLNSKSLFSFISQSCCDCCYSDLVVSKHFLRFFPPLGIIFLQVFVVKLFKNHQA